MLNKGTKIFRFICVIFIGLLAADYICQWLIWRDNQKFYATSTPFYSWALYSADGERVSSKDGQLKLQVDSSLGYVNFPNQKTANFSINSQGFRGLEVAKAKQKRRIVLLGGSAAFSTGLKSDYDTLSEQLSRLLNAEVINAGVIGYSSNQELSLFATKLISYQPDVVIALNGGNDFAKSFFKRGQTELEVRLKDLRNLNSPYFILRAFHTLTALFFPASRYVMLQKIYHPAEHSINPEALNEAALNYAANEITLSELIKAINARLLVVIQPQSNLVYLNTNGASGGEPDLKEGAIEYLHFSEIAKQILDKNNLQVLDLASQDIGLRADQFMDNVHLDVNGNRILAEKLATIIGTDNSG